LSKLVPLARQQPSQYLNVRDAFPRLRPTIVAVFVPRSSDANDGYMVHLHGTAIGDDGGGAYCGHLRLTRDVLNRYVDELRRQWAELVGFTPDRRRNSKDRPFATSLNLAETGHPETLREMMRKLAVEGWKLFQHLFFSGDATLKEIGRLLIAAFRMEPQAVSFQSDELFAPWWMLYVSPDGTDPEEPGYKWQYDGFLGYRHWIQHSFTRTEPDYQSTMLIEKHLKVGVNVDRRLDSEFSALQPVQKLINMFGAQRTCSLTVRDSRDVLRRDMVGNAINDNVLLFCCHASVTGNGKPHEAHFALSDGERITAGDLSRWLEGAPLSNPVLFMSVCEGGQMSSLFYPSFSDVLRRHGGHCLIGPLMEIPPTFAHWFADEFFRRIFNGAGPIGFVFHELVVESADRYSNPLGIALALYRGMDTHFRFLEAS
jgi:hypothetical protein